MTILSCGTARAFGRARTRAPDPNVSLLLRTGRSSLEAPRQVGANLIERPAEEELQRTVTSVLGYVSVASVGQTGPTQRFFPLVRVFSSVEAQPVSERGSRELGIYLAHP